MKKPDRAVLTQTARVGAGVAIMVVIMLAVYEIVGRFNLKVLGGSIYAGILGTANFFVLGMMIQGITEQVAERKRTEEEIATLSLQMQNRMKLSYNLRMIALFALLVLGIAVFHFDALATILAALFPSVVIRILQIMEARKGTSQGSEEH